MKALKIRFIAYCDQHGQFCIWSAAMLGIAAGSFGILGYLLFCLATFTVTVVFWSEIDGTCRKQYKREPDHA